MSEKRKIEVVLYNPAWVDMFNHEAAHIKQALGENCINIYHIGSTSVPGLAAKPIIDIIPVVKNILHVDLLQKEMEALGYTTRGEAGMLFRRFFYKDNMPRTHNVHIFEQGSAEIDRHVLFRDWMRNHADDRESYATLKQKLAEKFVDDIDVYCLAKEHFISDITAKTGFDGFRIVMALTSYEWDSYRQFFDEPLQKNDSFFHFVLYKGTKIMCAAHMELLNQNNVQLHISATDEDFNVYMTKQLERWTFHQGYKINGCYYKAYRSSSL